jgi:hypothetical protein
MTLLVIGIIIAVRFIGLVKREPRFADANVVADTGLRRNAVITIAIWVVIIFMGRFIAYDPLIWGTLSPLSS